MKRLLTLGILVVLGTGCASGGINQLLDSNIPKNTELLPTYEYIPERKLDPNTNQWLAYEAKPNPYTLRRDQVNQETIDIFLKVRSLIKESKIQRAITLLNKTKETHPRLSGPWVLLGDLAMSRKDLESAGEHYKKAIEINSNNINAYLRLAIQQRMQGKYIKAQHIYATALDIWPDCPHCHRNLAVLYDIYLNKSDQAQRHFETYHLLTNYSDQQVEKWIQEVQSRTGLEHLWPTKE